MTSITAVVDVAFCNEWQFKSSVIQLRFQLKEIFCLGHDWHICHHGSLISCLGQSFSSEKPTAEHAECNPATDTGMSWFKGVQIERQEAFWCLHD